MSETTVQTYRTRLRDFVTPAIGRRKLSELGKGDVLRVVDRCHEAALSEWATHGVLTALRAVLRFARERDYMTADPFVGVPRDRLPAKRARSETRALRPEDAALVLAELAKPRDEGDAERRRARRDYVLGCLLVDAGLRVSEACRAHLGRRRARRGRPARPRPARAAQAGETPRIVPPKSDARRPHGAAPAASAGGARGALRGRGRRRVRAPHEARDAALPAQRARSIREAGERAKLGHVTPHTSGARRGRRSRRRGFRRRRPRR